MDYSKYFPILEYYEKVVIPINPRRYRIKNEKMMVCPLHNDHDPSLGLIPNKKEEIFHCLGCGQWGSIVDLHIRVCKRHFKKYMSEEEAVRDLCRIFGVDYNTLPKPDLNREVDKDIRQEVALAESIEKFDISDFRNLFLEGKQKKKGIGYFNTLTMIMLNEVKERNS